MKHIVIYLCLVLSISRAWGQQKDRCTLNLSGAKVSHAAEADLEPLMAIGFDRTIAKKILSHQPKFLALYRAYKERHKDDFPPDFQETGPLPEVVTLYRGLKLNSIEEYDPNFGIFTQGERHHYGGIISTSTRYRESATYNFVVTYQMPKALLGAGREFFEYRFGPLQLEEMGIHDLEVFQVSIEPKKHNP